MKKLKQFWNFLNGKKTAIGTAVWVVAKGAQLFVPGIATPEQLEFISTVGEIIAVGGLAHKGWKTDVVQKTINKINTKN